ncbi:hypothetical protein FB567DRAFT_584656 [Paraphoma chrysanthemicola]|uniref:Glucans biosynthesis glucosyltransferase H n=1 Tax=Paraphoma chrysanthemicola TaxID=798071 RepID=A0A8K0VS09_9PLEO|nr:hypothetical protein FB567DRAFT_584656 [Paraphoma chrysanthemicola]
MSKVRTTAQQIGMSGYQRHWLIISLCFTTLSLTLWNDYTRFKAGGITFLEGIIMFSTLVGMVQHATSFWTCVIGLMVTLFGNAERSIYPYFDAKGPLPELRSRTAILIFMRNEDPSPIFKRLLAIQQSLSEIGRLKHFRFVLLSDTSLTHVKCMEEEGFAHVKDALSQGTYGSCFYRRRNKNIGYKGGNMYDYAANHSEDDDFFVPLDSDSIMGGDILVRLASSMERNPRLGLIQPAFICLPSGSAFARVLQFGIRYWFLIHYLGMSWWTHDCALFYGHNAILRTKVFREHCKLPILAGKAPLGGHILGHDVVEALFMRRAGYECQHLPLITDDYEAHPPNMVEHVKREGRWFLCAMQYFFLLKEPGLRPINRFQVFRMICQHLSPVAWFVVMLASSIRPRQETANSTQGHAGVSPQFVIAVWRIFPRIVAVLAFVATPSEFQRYGGVLRFVVGAVLEQMFMSIIRRSYAVSTSIFLCGVLCGKSITWEAQNRDQLGLSWRYTYRMFWAETLVGFGILLLMMSFDVSRELRDIAISLLLVVPISVLSASPRLSRIVIRLGLFTYPEENTVSPLLYQIVVPELAPKSKGI